jgi:hypothetical protein
MKVTGFDGRVYNLKFKKINGKCSKNHEKARVLLKKMFPFDSIYEETLLLGSKKGNRPNLKADFIIPSKKMLIEIHGQQHYEYSSFFHGTKLKFLEHKSRDVRKIEWCELNNITYIELPHNETESQWIYRIENV